MTQQRFLPTAVALAAVVGMVVVASMQAASSASIPAPMETFSHPEGTNYFALSLTPKGVAPAVASCDVVVMFNTSASQTGPSRTSAMEALKGILIGLGPQDRVQLVAVDLNPVRLTKTFVAPSGKEMTAALAALEARVPLGATDMKKALAAAAASFQGESKNARSVVYLGDGRSTANAVSAQEFDDLAKKLTDARISVSSYIVGDRPDPQILGALAGKTGGVMMEYNAMPLDPQAATQMAPAQLAAAEAAAEKKTVAQLAAAVTTPVLWPTSVKWPAEMTEVLPKQAPPLRLDRDSVVIGKFKGKGPFEVQYEVATPAGPQQFVFSTVAAANSGDKNSYLVTLVKWAENNNGVPLIGSQSLENAKKIATNSTQGWKNLAKQALSAGNAEGAEKLAEAVLRQDPNNIEALNVKDAVAKLRKRGPTVKNMSAQAPVQEPPPAPPAPPAPEDLPPAGPATELNLVGPSAPVDDPNAGTFLEDVQHRSNVITQQAQAQVRATIDDARRQMSVDPRGVSTNLRLLLEQIRQVPEINPDVRDQLIGQLQAALQETARRQVEFDRVQQRLQEQIAIAKELRTITDNELRDQMKVKQLMSRFNSLMDEGRYKIAEEQVATEVQRMMPNTPLATAATLGARNADYFHVMQVIREARIKGMVDALASVERSHVPFDDSEPIVYPDPEFWRRISDKDNPESRISKYSSMELSKPNSAENDIQQALKDPTTMEFTDTPLSDVVDYLRDLHKGKHPSFEIVLDTKALSDLGVTPETPVTEKLEGHFAPLSVAIVAQGFRIDLHDPRRSAPYHLARCRREQSHHQSLSRRRSCHTSQFQYGNGRHDGRHGWRHDGWHGRRHGRRHDGRHGRRHGRRHGWYGRRHGRHGYVQRAPEPAPQRSAGRLQALLGQRRLERPGEKDTQASAQPEKKVASKANEEVPASVTSAVAPKAAAAKAAPKNVEKIQIEIAAGEKPETVWDNYFSTHTPDQAAVRDAVRRLMYEAKYDHVIALIGAALRHQQPQPWMYEAMGLAMQAAGRPQEDIERAVMSAVDFAQNPSDLLYVGAYLLDMGLNSRALDVFRQVAAIDPMRSEPYMLGLKAARLMKDLDGLRWASLGILSQAWPKEHANVWQAGVGVAEEVLAKLKAEKRTKEAEEFRAALDKAVQRDCVVVVNYTGDAQLDLAVLEPSGSVCSFRAPRTSSGGMLLGDAIAQTNADNGGGKSEVYVCPQGFDGTYRIDIRRVFGNVATGKVHVKVMTHYLGKSPISIEKTIPLVKDEAKIAFDLKDGRRKELIADRQIANAAEGQLKLNAGVQVLAQQIDSAINPAALNALSRANSLNGGQGTNGGLGGLAALPFLGAGAVGYQPQITTLPEGANLMATAVISADRRYVRVSSMPIFSGIGQVNTFNTFTGQGGTTSGGTGGQGFGGLSGGQTSGSSGSFAGGGAGF